MDVTTGTILYAKNIHERLYPASTTKIMTALVAIELSEPEQPLTVDTDIPEEEEEPTRRFGDDAPAKKKRSFDDFRFDDNIG